MSLKFEELYTNIKELCRKKPKSTNYAGKSRKFEEL